VVGESIARQYPAIELLDRIGALRHVKLDSGRELSDLLAEQLARESAGIQVTYYGSTEELRNFDGYAGERGISVGVPVSPHWRLNFEALLGEILQNLTGFAQAEIESRINFPQLVADLKLLGDV